MRTERTPTLRSALLDLSFSVFLTPRLVRVLYALALLIVGLLALFVVGSALVVLADSPLTAIGYLLLGALACVFLLIGARIWLEAVVVFFRIADHTAETAEHGAEIAMNTAREAWRHGSTMPAEGGR